MMKMEVEIVSKDRIIPSSPTPSHLRIFKLSLLDQLIPAPFAPIILFYDNSDPSYNTPNLTKPCTTTTHLDDDDDDNNEDEATIMKRLHVLKTSLSETLTGFYPLAGQIKDDLSIDCNDQGAHYVEARVKNSTLREFLNRPDDLILLLHGFLPCDLTNNNTGARVTNIQVNVFKCGGMAIGLCISHKILDGAGLCTFIKAWTATARLRSSLPRFALYSRPSSLSSSSSSLAPSDSVTLSSSSDSDDNQTPRAASRIIHPTKPNISAATCLFPTNDELWLRDSSLRMWGSLFINDGKSSCVTRRLVFEGSAIAALKGMVAAVNNNYKVKRPTRVEVVSAFIWQCAMAASKQIHGFIRPSLLTHAVNLRSRITSMLDLDLEYSIGNLLWIAAARCRTPIVTLDDNDAAADGLQLHGLVEELRNAVSKIDGDFVNKMRSAGEEEEGKYHMLESLEELRSSLSSESDYYGFSSWCNFGFYEGGDFGWGKPVWVSSVGSTGNSVFLNLIILVDTKSGDGIEAWVTLDQQHMAILQCNPQLRKFVSLDPTPLLLL
ncbi:vinorine synthase-like [Pyrus ussuriensis x Pyrus communis]|uniref:Vinorine synthase-like n=1 Tax=Pyrus ussuriensis x Pyrus communis TaxID=2448454 RepID=A0A5N5IHR9_9ROSA|nr:(13S,14R)-1,13-dihydroxy-N-methylcanadine 13-O-acetyltransferase AT1-like [Pyrus x bretschneideri]KAB2634804.1 vinorine synthase-like [Pyrus ussuriensis x Pyrus communis]